MIKVTQKAYRENLGQKKGKVNGDLKGEKELCRLVQFVIAIKISLASEMIGTFFAKNSTPIGVAIKGIEAVPTQMLFAVPKQFNFRLANYRGGLCNVFSV